MLPIRFMLQLLLNQNTLRAGGQQGQMWEAAYLPHPDDILSEATDGGHLSAHLSAKSRSLAGQDSSDPCPDALPGKAAGFLGQPDDPSIGFQWGLQGIGVLPTLQSFAWSEKGNRDVRVCIDLGSTQRRPVPTCG
jgi:hypothetical protein